jgi:hypothetical protein
MTPLNPYFLQGSSSEQRLIQDLINEQLKMYGQDVVYMPRKFIGEKTVIKENIYTKFDDSFRLEAYILNFDGFGGQGDILSKFGVRSTDELTLIISKERYEELVSPFLMANSDVKVSIRPEEGDLIYFPLDNSLFEIKYVEGKRPFYQLNNLYVYELKCELFEYEDEVINTSIDEVDESVQDFGYIATLTMVGSSATSLVLSNPQVNIPQSVSYIDIINDGYGYITPPRIAISSAPSGGQTASAVAVMKTIPGRTGSSIDKILITNSGYGYTTPPSVQIISSSGSGGIATAIIDTGVLGPISIINGGLQYSSPPLLTISPPPSANGRVAIATASINSSGTVTSVRYIDAGSGYLQAFSRTITIQSPVGTSQGNYVFNEQVIGQSSGTKGYVKDWDSQTRSLKVSIVDGTFSLGESIVGTAASYKLLSVNNMDDFYDTYADNVTIETEADNIIDFSERNPFGDY